MLGRNGCRCLRQLEWALLLNFHLLLIRVMQRVFYVQTIILNVGLSGRHVQAVEAAMLIAIQEVNWWHAVCGSGRPAWKWWVCLWMMMALPCVLSRRLMPASQCICHSIIEDGGFHGRPHLSNHAAQTIITHKFMLIISNPYICLIVNVCFSFVFWCDNNKDILYYLTSYIYL